MQRGSPFGAIALLGVSATVFVPNDGEACGNEVQMAQAVEADVLKAEREVAVGDFAGALNDLRDAYEPSDRYAHQAIGVPGSVARRAVLVAGRMVAHSNGAIPFPPARIELPFAALNVKDTAPGADVDAVHSAAFWLEHIALDRPNDPVALADAAEIDARIPEKRAKAKQTLSDLEQRDVVPSGWAYAALATVRTTRASDQPAWLGAPLRTLGYAQASLERARCARMLKGAKNCDAWADDLGSRSGR